MKLVTVHQTAIIPATPARIYSALISSKEHSAITGAKASMSAKKGGKWNAFEGWCSGKNVQLIKNKKITQTWRGDDWPAKHYSEVTFTLTPTKTGTKLTLDHKNVPANQAVGVREGWKEYYWKPMKKYFNKA